MVKNSIIQVRISSETLVTARAKTKSLSITLSEYIRGLIDRDLRILHPMDDGSDFIGRELVEQLPKEEIIIDVEPDWKKSARERLGKKIGLLRSDE